jgi:hypothetical protein
MRTPCLDQQKAMRILLPAELTDLTTIWAENNFTTVDIGPFEVDWFRTEFGGPVIFLAEVAKDSENEEGEFRPSAPLDGIMGVGWSAEHAGQSGGTGVVGIGGAVGGRGVFGKGGEGGPGVVGDAGGAATGLMGFGARAQEPVSLAYVSPSGSSVTPCSVRMLK